MTEELRCSADIAGRKLILYNGGADNPAADFKLIEHIYLKTIIASKSFKKLRIAQPVTAELKVASHRKIAYAVLLNKNLFHKILSRYCRKFRCKCHGPDFLYRRKLPAYKFTLFLFGKKCLSGHLNLYKDSIKIPLFGLL